MKIDKSFFGELAELLRLRLSLRNRLYRILKFHRVQG